MKRFYYTGIPAIIVLIFFLFLHSSPVTAASGSRLLVTRVNDGDTVSVRTRSIIGIPLKIERVRLIGIDAPELRQEPWGRKAKKHLKELISRSDWVVTMEYDTERTDRYGRTLAYLRGKDGRLINERMIEDGYAVLYTFPPNVKYADRIMEAQKRAQLRRAGFWREGGLRESPGKWRKEHPRG